MSEPDWAPVPWTYRFDPEAFDDWGQIRDGDGRAICEVRTFQVSDAEKSIHRHNGTDPYAATAHLIAAAPDLYEALQKACIALIEIRACSLKGAEQGYGKPEIWGEGLYKSHGYVQDALDVANAALAKARGEA